MREETGTSLISGFRSAGAAEGEGQAEAGGEAGQLESSFKTVSARGTGTFLLRRPSATDGARRGDGALRKNEPVPAGFG
jgi:hypothetical protein